MEEDNRKKREQKVHISIKKRVNRVMLNTAAIISAKYGKGMVVLCGPHPEQTVGLEYFTLQMILSAMPAA